MPWVNSVSTLIDCYWFSQIFGLMGRLSLRKLFYFIRNLQHLYYMRSVPLLCSIWHAPLANMTDVLASKQPLSSHRRGRKGLYCPNMRHTIVSKLDSHEKLGIRFSYKYQEEFPKFLGEKDIFDRIWEPFNPSESHINPDGIGKPSN